MIANYKLQSVFNRLIFDKQLTSNVSSSSSSSFATISLSFPSLPFPSFICSHSLSVFLFQISNNKLFHFVCFCFFSLFHFQICLVLIKLCDTVSFLCVNCRFVLFRIPFQFPWIREKKLCHSLIPSFPFLEQFSFRLFLFFLLLCICFAMSLFFK